MKHDDCTCTVEISPDEVDAGTELTLKVRVASPRVGSLSGTSVSIRARDDAEVACAELRKADEDAYEANGIVLTAPRVVGEHVYRAVVVTADKGGPLQELASAEVRFIVKPHAAELNVWDVPPAIVAGERFKFMASAKCSAGCVLAGQGLSIVDPEGSQVGVAKLGRDIWPGTDALYFAEVEAEAPPTAGSYYWELKTAAWDCELPHEAGLLALAIKVVSAPDCEVTVEAIDRDKQTPIKGARVVMHPYRATTDENGAAKVSVAKGQYDILVSASKYVPFSTTVDVTADTVTRAELDVDRSWEPPEDEI